MVVVSKVDGEDDSMSEYDIHIALPTGNTVCGLRWQVVDDGAVLGEKAYASVGPVVTCERCREGSRLLEVDDEG